MCNNELSDVLMIIAAAFVCAIATWFVVELILWRIGFFKDNDGK